MRYRLLALDVDGTLLDPKGELSPEVGAAVQRAVARGMRVVLCTGRRFRTAIPLCHALGLEGDVVVHNGAIVKDIATGTTRHPRYLPDDVYPDVLPILREVGPPMVYVDAYPDDTDILTERPEEAHPFQRKYLADFIANYRAVPDLAALRRSDVIMISMMADPDTLDGLRIRVLGSLGDRVHTHSLINKNYEGHILEFLSPESDKWSALRRVAADAGIADEEIAAIGDDRNDASMLRGAGLGIAMGNAIREVRAAADVVVETNARGGVIDAIDRLVLRDFAAHRARRRSDSPDR